MNSVKSNESKEISCVFATDNNYAPYCGVAIQSLINNVSTHSNYVIYILEESLNSKYKKNLQKLNAPNVKIKFINIKEILSQYPRDIFYTHGHFSKATYYRFFIPDIFPDIKKIIYLDCDLIVNHDIKDLINTNSNCISAVSSAIYKKAEELDYIKSLNLENVYNYFNAGVLVFDIDKLKEFNFTKRCIEILKKYKNLQLLDQDVLNILFNKNVQLLECKWNVFNHLLFKNYKQEHRTAENKRNYDYLEKASKSPNILHYTSDVKPWNNLFCINSSYFWRTAIFSPFIFEIMLIMFKTYKKKLGSYMISYLKKIIKHIFSIRNNDNKSHKILTIFGFKIKWSIQSTL